MDDMRRNRVFRGSGVKPLAHRRVLLVDLENLAYEDGACLPTDHVEERVCKVLAAAGRTDYAIAVAPHAALVRYGAGLARLGLRWEECSTGRDAADARIVARAGELADLGYEEFVIASADHYFAVLASVGRLTVVVPTGVGVSKVLRHASDQLIAA
jgi:hypothetical protein